MELVERYVAAVQRELPEQKRQEIGRELSANIMDQLDALKEQNGQLSEDDIAAVLKQMGRPEVVAYQFVPPKALVAAEDMPLLKHLLYMVLGVLFVVQIVGSTTHWMGSSEGNLIRFLLQLTFGFLEDACFAFTVIVLSFAAVNSAGDRVSRSGGKDWSPKLLPKADLGWQHISMTDVFTDLATCLFLLIVIWYPLWMSPAQIADRSIMFTDNALLMMQWFSPVVALSVLFSLWQLRQRIWNRSLLLGNILVNATFSAFFVALALSGPLLQAGPVEIKSLFTLLQLEEGFTYGLLITACIPAYEAIRDLFRFNKLN
ncbi:MAG: hypothetical protein KJ556_03805 [Gammaproteobacteria bacterium]|nr:hypothetical protein [Gammaproteobacteria bacterium]MBU2056504.1 hypothetical protein [Gammaproteobacteria bacterium]MBU2174233.1 hypothetical protein [Gammaproteobacteria bacterium]MBU2248716.1 hypothetical protein [Gammaproteobacteria bacterium]MBU2344646.1 hypothetical protein [Gammaproteobacteria bacterium]